MKHKIEGQRDPFRSSVQYNFEYYNSMMIKAEKFIKDVLLLLFYK